MAFQILNNINRKFGSGIPSLYQIIDANKAIPIYTDGKDGLIMAVGTYLKSKLIVFPKHEFIFENNILGAILRKNSMKYLTGGKCIDFRKCSHSIDDYQKYIGYPDIVFHVTTFSKCNQGQLIKYMANNIWHFIAAGTFWAELQLGELQNFTNLFGIKITKGHGVDYWENKENLCKFEATMKAKV